MFYHAIPPVSSGLHNLFFAIRPPVEICERMADLAASFAIGGRPMRLDRLHITVLQLVCGDVLPDGLAEEAAAIAATLDAAPFSVYFNQLVAGERSTLLRSIEPLDALCSFRERLGLLLRQAGLGFRMDQPFNPHVTLLYGNTQAFVTQDDPIIWRVEEFVLIDSHIGETRHDEVGRWPLLG